MPAYLLSGGDLDGHVLPLSTVGTIEAIAFDLRHGNHVVVGQGCALALAWRPSLKIPHDPHRPYDTVCYERSSKPPVNGMTVLEMVGRYKGTQLIEA
jgi:hypothetical protein